MNVYIPGTGFATQGPCPDGFHVPLWSDWATLRSTMSSLSSDNASGYINKLYMPLAGLRSSAAGALTNQGVTGYYDCASASTSYNGWRRYLYINSSNGVLNYDEYRATGMTIRPFKNGFVEPDSTWTAIQGTVGGNGIFWNSGLGLISIIYSSNKITIADKNLGATEVFDNYNPSYTAATCGNYYQWGNNYGFPWTGSITTSGTKVDASNYGPGNYYSSSTFIYSNSGAPNDWSTVQNDNLRGGVDGNVQSVYELKNAYIGEYKERQPDSNTIVYWKLDGDTKDSSGNNRDGTASGTLAYESIGSIDVAKFTGSQEVYRSGSEFTLGGNHPFTFSVWIKPTSLSNPVPIATIQKSDNRGTRDKELVVQGNGSFYGYFYSGDANYIYDNTGEVTTSHWNYLTFTFDGSTLKLYLNGTLKNTVTPTSGSYTIASPKLVLSSYYYRGSYRYSGYMSNFILQNNAWTADYISNYYNTYKGLYGLS